LYDRLESVHDVFLDRQGGLRVPQDWSDELSQFVDQCDAMLVLIGPRWLDELLERSASGSVDPVSVEIERALRLNKVVIPILIGGADLPNRSRLPEPLRALVDRQCAVLDVNQPRQGIRDITEGLKRDQPHTAIRFDQTQKPTQSSGVHQPPHANPALQEMSDLEVRDYYGDEVLIHYEQTLEPIPLYLLDGRTINQSDPFQYYEVYNSTESLLNYLSECHIAVTVEISDHADSRLLSIIRRIFNQIQRLRRYGDDQTNVASVVNMLNQVTVGTHYINVYEIERINEIGRTKDLEHGKGPSQYYAIKKIEEIEAVNGEFGTYKSLVKRDRYSKRELLAFFDEIGLDNV
jgi:hypothetical protein